MGLFGTIGSVGGAALGNAVLPGIGGVIGGALGGALGNSLEPQTSMPNNALNPGVTGAQNQLVSQLQQQANGQGPNPALGMMRKANDENIRQNTGFVASQKGINPALAGRLAAQNQAMMAQKNAADMGIIQAQQQIQAQQNLAGVLSGQQTANIQNQQLQLQNQQANNQRSTQMFGGVLNGIGGYLGHKYGQPDVQKAQQQEDVVQMSEGGHVPGEAKVMGNSEANDTVPAMLSPGEIVIPRTHAKSPEMAKRFIDQVLKNKKTHAKEKDIDEIDVAQVMKVNSQMKKRIAQLEKKAGK
jgi:hypothetical protein